MSELLIPGLVAVAVAAIGAFATYLIGRRSASGSVDTTQAETLWNESRAMREELRDEVLALRAEVLALRADTVQMQAEIEVNRVELRHTRDHAARCDRQLSALRAKVEALSDKPK